MLAIGMLAAAAGLVLGLRFSLITLLLLTLAIVIAFATGVLGGSGSLAVGLQMLATLASVQISYLFGCLLQHIFPCGPRYPPNTANAESVGTHSCAGPSAHLWSGEMRCLFAWAGQAGSGGARKPQLPPI